MRWNSLWTCLLLVPLTGCFVAMSDDDSDAVEDDNREACDSFDSLQCDGNDLFWVDSCGNVGEMAQECGADECSEEFQGCCDPAAEPGQSCTSPTTEEPPVVTEPPARCADSFTDVAATDLGADDIRALYVNDVVNGCSSDPLSYCPAEATQRNHAAVMLINAMGEQPSTAAVDAYFCDVSGSSAAYANRLYELGITTGCITETPCADPAKKTYCPLDAAQRDHMAVFLVRALGTSPSTAAANAYFDDATPLFAGYINRLYELGVTTGCGARQYCSLEPTLRWQAAAFIARAFDLSDAVCTVSN